MRETIRVARERILSCASFTEVLRLCFEVSGRGKGEVAWDCGWRDGGRVLSRILRDCEGDDSRWMPHDKLIPFMVACGNLAPLWWLMLQMEVLPRDDPRHGEPSFTEEFLEEQRECRRLLAEVLEAIRSAEPAGLPAATAHFCLVDRPVLPDWVLGEAMEISRKYGAWLYAHTPDWY